MGTGRSHAHAPGTVDGAGINGVVWLMDGVPPRERIGESRETHVLAGGGGKSESAG